MYRIVTENEYISFNIFKYYKIDENKVLTNEAYHHKYYS